LKTSFLIPARTLFIFAMALIGLTGCKHLPPSKPLSELTPQELAGHQVFATECARCHYADSEQGMKGPGLEGLFRMKDLPSGRAANDDRVTDIILHGYSMMPALGNEIGSRQLTDLLAYLHTL
jgi:mono/diheme cytochrome c family protein